MPIDIYEQYAASSVHKKNNDTLLLGRYDDGGATSYVTVAEKNGWSYFSLGNKWNSIMDKYKFTNKNMFDTFNIKAINDATKAGKNIIFSHNPTIEAYDGTALRNEWLYLQNNFGYKKVDPIGKTGLFVPVK